MTIEDQIKAAERELAMRQRVYPGMVLRGRMSQETAAHETEAMAAIVATLRERKQPELGL